MILAKSRRIKKENHLAERIRKSVANLDKVTLPGEERQSATEIAADMLGNTVIPEKFQSAKIRYYDFFDGNITETVYIIGYGMVFPIGNGKKAPMESLIFIRRFCDGLSPENRLKYVSSKSLDEITSFRLD